MEVKMFWVFNSPNSKFSGGIFEQLKGAEEWIERNNLTGVLTKYPLNKGTLEWAIENNFVSMKAEKLKEKQKNPNFICGFTSASMEHHHYENGKKE